MSDSPFLQFIREYMTLTITVCVWSGKGGKHRTVTLATELSSQIKTQTLMVEKYLEIDKCDANYSGVYLPHALRHKYVDALMELGWHYLFPSRR